MLREKIKNMIYLIVILNQVVKKIKTAFKNIKKYVNIKYFKNTLFACDQLHNHVFNKVIESGYVFIDNFCTKFKLFNALRNLLKINYLFLIFTLIGISVCLIFLTLYYSVQNNPNIAHWQQMSFMLFLANLAGHWLGLIFGCWVVVKTFVPTNNELLIVYYALHYCAFVYPTVFWLTFFLVSWFIYWIYLLIIKLKPYGYLLSQTLSCLIKRFKK